MAEAMGKMLEGARKLYNVICPALGPEGKTSVLDQKYDIPRTAANSIEILRDFSLPDAAENMGASMLARAAEKVYEAAGDGAGRTVFLAFSIAEEGYRRIAAGANPILLRRGIAGAAAVVYEKLGKISRACSASQIEQIAAVAAGDKEAGRLTAEAFAHAGMDGIVRVEESQLPETELMHASGICFESGLLSGFSAAWERGKTVLENPYILLLNIKADSLEELLPILEEAAENHCALLLIVRDMDAEVLKVLTQNAARGILDVAVVSGPGHGDTRQLNMEILASLTGAVLIDEDTRWRLERADLSLCGRAAAVCVDKNTTRIQGASAGDGRRAGILYQRLKKRLEEEPRDFEREKLEQALSMLQNCMETIRVGGRTELEMFENKYKFDSAVRSVYVAVKTGVVPGGGKALLLALPEAEQYAEKLTGDERAGAEVLCRVLPLYAAMLAENAGFDGAAAAGYMKNSAPEQGFDCVSGQMTDLVSAGILDTAASVQLPLIHGAGIASTLLTSGSAVVSGEPV